MVTRAQIERLNLRIEAIVEAINPSPPPEYVVIMRFAGESAEEFHARYPDIPKADKVFNLTFNSGVDL